MITAIFVLTLGATCGALLVSLIVAAFGEPRRQRRATIERRLSGVVADPAP